MRVAVLFHDGCWVRSRIVEAAIKRLAGRYPQVILCDQDHPLGMKVRKATEAAKIPFTDVHELPQKWWSKLLGDTPTDQLLKACDSVVVFWDNSSSVRTLAWRAISLGKRLLVVHVGGRDVIPPQDGGLG